MTAAIDLRVGYGDSARRVLTRGGSRREGEHRCSARRVVGAGTICLRGVLLNQVGRYGSFRYRFRLHSGAVDGGIT